jgi:hypothetical protein
MKFCMLINIKLMEQQPFKAERTLYVLYHLLYQSVTVHFVFMGLVWPSV